MARILKLVRLLRDTRKKQGLSREAVAQEIGATSGSIYRWETGRSAPNNLSKKAIIKWLEEQGVSYEEK